MASTNKKISQKLKLVTFDIKSMTKLANIDYVILCGGLGKRLRSIESEKPKVMVQVDDKPFLDTIILQLKAQGIRRVILCTGYKAEMVEDHYRKNNFGLTIEFSREASPLGTGGALRYAVDSVRSSHFLALNGDSWVDQPLAPVVAEHVRASWQVTALAVQAERVEGKALQKGLLKLGTGREVLGFHTSENAASGWVNGGCYVFERSVVAAWPGGAYSLEADWDSLLGGKRVGAYCSQGRLLDIGTPQTYGRAAEILGNFEGALQGSILR